MSRERDRDEAGEELANGSVAGEAASVDEAGELAEPTETSADEGEEGRRLARSMAAAIERHAERARDAEGEPPEAEDARAVAGEDEAAGDVPPSAEDGEKGASADVDGRGGDESDDAEAAAVDEELPPLAAVIEAVLFAAAEPVPMGRLSRLLASWPRAAVAEALAGFGESLAVGERGVRLVETATGYQLRSAPEAAAWVRRFFTDKPPRLSRPMLETVAIVAYRQPVTRGEIESIRGVNCDAVLETLVTRGLVRVTGRRQSPGRPVEYGTTAEFLDLFSLRDLSQLPPLPDPAALASLIDDDAEPEANREAAGGDEEIGALEGGAGEAAEDPEPGGAGVAPDGGGLDPGGTGEGEREGGAGAGDEGGPDPGPDHH